MSAPNPQSGLQGLLSSPQLWRAQDLAATPRPQGPTGLPTSLPQLDELLPGRGWPRAGVTEILCDGAGIGELRLLAAGLAQLSQHESRWIVWVNPPFLPYAPALASYGIDVGKNLLVRTQASATANRNLSGIQHRHKDLPAPTDVNTASHRDALWVLQQALESGACSAVLAWLDERKLRIADLRRLQLRAQQGGAWAVLFRPEQAAAQPSAAELRLRLRPGKGPSPSLAILKRRGGWPIEDVPYPATPAPAVAEAWTTRQPFHH